MTRAGAATSSFAVREGLITSRVTFANQYGPAIAGNHGMIQSLLILGLCHLRIWTRDDEVDDDDDDDDGTDMIWCYC